jgi:hypothetical protein
MQLRFKGGTSHARAIELQEALAMTIMTRRQLYDLIWSKPMRDAAAEIGISDVGLKKVCVRHRVPVPPQGYWNKVHSGQTPPKATFREVEGIESAGFFNAGSTPGLLVSVGSNERNQLNLLLRTAT